MNPNQNDMGTNVLAFMLLVFVIVAWLLALTGCTPPPCGADVRYSPDPMNPGQFAAYRIGENPYGSWTWAEINAECGKGGN